MCIRDRDYTIDIRLSDDQGNLVPFDGITTFANAHVLFVEGTDGANRVNGNTIFLNPNLSDNYIISAQSISSALGNSCGMSEINGSAVISFDNILNLTLDTTLCMGEVFDFQGVQYSTDSAEDVVVSQPLLLDTTTSSALSVLY